MVTDEKFQKFLGRIDKLINDLKVYHTIEIHGHVNQFYYMQKMTELKLLKERMEESEKRVIFMQEVFETEYREVFSRWNKDARWLNIYKNSITSDVQKPDAGKIVL